MKALNNYIIEKFQVSKNNIRTYAYEPKNRNELIQCIKDKIEEEGLGTKNKPLDLNDIDTSKITDMSELFDCTDGELKDLSENGYFNISDWDVSNVEDMWYMFYGSCFNGDISDWDVSNVEDMTSMFAYSRFTGKNGNIGKWNVVKVKNMHCMFVCSEFNGNISGWDVSNVEDMYGMFTSCPLQKNPPEWYKE